MYSNTAVPKSQYNVEKIIELKLEHFERVRLPNKAKVGSVLTVP